MKRVPFAIASCFPALRTQHQFQCGLGSHSAITTITLRCAMTLEIGSTIFKFTLQARPTQTPVMDLTQELLCVALGLADTQNTSLDDALFPEGAQGQEDQYRADEPPELPNSIKILCTGMIPPERVSRVLFSLAHDDRPAWFRFASFVWTMQPSLSGVDNKPSK